MSRAVQVTFSCYECGEIRGAKEKFNGNTEKAREFVDRIPQGWVFTATEDPSDSFLLCSECNPESEDIMTACMGVLNFFPEDDSMTLRVVDKLNLKKELWYEITRPEAKRLRNLLDKFLRETAWFSNLEH